jgi:hypothetical protein
MDWSLSLEVNMCLGLLGSQIATQFCLVSIPRNVQISFEGVGKEQGATQNNQGTFQSPPCTTAENYIIGE